MEVKFREFLNWAIGWRFSSFTPGKVVVTTTTITPLCESKTM
jgi:hypothetical protein